MPDLPICCVTRALAVAYYSFAPEALQINKSDM